MIKSNLLFAIMFKILFIGYLSIQFFSCSIKNKNSTFEHSINSNEIKWIENNLSNPIHVKGEKTPRYSIQSRMEFYNVPGISIAIVRQGEIEWSKGYGIADYIDSLQVKNETIFQAASVGKIVSSVGALRLVEQGEIDLDEDISKYLKSWKLPSSEFTSSKKVTMRMLLTHTAGTTVSGFSGYKQNDYFPTDIEVLNGEGNSPAVIIDYTPGSEYRYSGGGFTIVERIIEDVSKLSFAAFMEKAVFAPLKMENSTFEQPLPERLHKNASAAFEKDGNMVEGKWYNYPEQAAAGLWTCPIDLAKLIIELHQSYHGKSNKILTQGMIREMLTKDEFGHGLGPGLIYEGDSLAYLHGGKNKGFTSFLVAYPHIGDGIIIMSGSDSADPLIKEIQRSAAEYYGWQYNKPKIVQVEELALETLNKRVGRYLYKPRNYELIVGLENGELVLIDPNRNNLKYHLRTLNKSKCIQLSTGTMFEFRTDKSGEVTEMIQDGKYKINKIE